MPCFFYAVTGVNGAFFDTSAAHTRENGKQAIIIAGKETVLIL